MPLETTDKISGLNSAWPLGSDAKSQGDDHLRLLKSVLQSDAVPLEHVERVNMIGGAASSGSVILGDMLVQWGTADTSASPSGFGVVFPTPFKAVPACFVCPLSDAGAVRTAHVRTRATFQLVMASFVAGVATGMDVMWFAVGTAQDAAALAKGVSAYVEPDP